MKSDVGFLGLLSWTGDWTPLGTKSLVFSLSHWGHGNHLILFETRLDERYNHTNAIPVVSKFLLILFATSSQLNHAQASPLSNTLQTPVKRPFSYLLCLLVTNQRLSVMFPPNKRSTLAVAVFQHFPRSLASLTNSRYHSAHPQSSAFS